MIHTLTISHGLWGYVTHLSDFSGGRARLEGKTPDGLHTLSRGADSKHLVPGVPDSKFRPHSGYGFVRPRPEDGPDQKLWEQWDRCRLDRLDYYVALMNGSPDPQAVPFYYPERLFVTGDYYSDSKDLGGQLFRTDLLNHLSALGIQAHPEYWHPVQIFHGIKGGFPLFDQGLKADTDVGPTWYSVQGKLKTKLPDGYDWDFSGGNYGTLYFEPQEVVTP
jgi:hypothetical protein